VTFSDFTSDEKLLWELKEGHPRREKSPHIQFLSDRYDIIDEELSHDEVFYPFLLSGIPDGVTLQIQVLVSRLGWKATKVNAGDLDADSCVRVTLDGPPQEAIVEVTDKDGNSVNDARFEIPHFTSNARETHELAKGSLLGYPLLKVPAEDFNPYLGIGKKYTFETKEGDEETGKWVEAGGPPHRKVLRVSPGKYRLLVYPGMDFPILVKSRLAGECRIHGDQLLRSLRVTLE
jgi:hypothetical protein